MLGKLLPAVPGGNFSSMTLGHIPGLRPCQQDKSDCAVVAMSAGFRPRFITRAEIYGIPIYESVEDQN
jgi:hypothetical protein